MAIPRFCSVKFRFLVGSIKAFLLLILLIDSHIICAQNKRQNSWSVKFEGMGLFSSPRVADFNGDGVGDIVLGAGREEFKPCDTAVFAINGVDGTMLWRLANVDHVFGSAALKDLNLDGVQDVIIGGRSASLFALNGKNGDIIWKFDKTKGGIKWFNFYNAQFIKDQDRDGVEDILVSNGGNVLAAPFDRKERKPGNLVVLSGANGKLLARAQVPDGNETYMSVVVWPTADNLDYRVVYGTGGETLGGNLYVTTLSAIMKGDLSKSILLDTSPTKGYIGPPVLADITKDGVADIIANAVEGKLLAFDGGTYKPIWAVKVPETEAYSSVAPGYFTGNDDIPDFFATYAVGQWPDLGWSRQLMVDGATGKIVYEDSLGSYQTSTPVVIDLDEDGIDEALLNVNIQAYDQLNNATFQNIMLVVNFKGNEVLQVWDSQPGSNIASTPWIGDLDNDGLLDIIYCHGTNVKKTYSFRGLQVNRIATGLPLNTEIRWGAYMGNHYDGIFRKR
jgi:outer membrane protein assembly factor BamB